MGKEKKYTDKEIINNYLKSQEELFEEIRDSELFFDKTKLDKAEFFKKKFEERFVK